MPPAVPVRVATPRSPLASLVLVSSAVAALTLAAAAHADAPNVHAIVGARIVIAPGRVIERGTVVMRDGIIVAVGDKVSVPADARVWPGDSLTVYPGLIDPFVTPADAKRGAGGASAGDASASRAPRGAAHSLSTVTPEARVVESLPLASDQLEGLRAAGFATAQVAPRRGIVRGNSAVIGLGDSGPNESVLAPDAAQVISLETAADGYPGSLMGAIALIRQTLMDARWYRDVWASYTKSPVGKPRPETNVSWASLAPVVAGTQPVVMVADEMLEVLRSAAIAKEAGIRAYVVTAGDEYKRVKEIAATGMSLVVPVAFPEAPDVSDDAAALEVATETLRFWNEAPGNPAALARANVTFALTSQGLKDPKTFRANVAKAIERGLPADKALAAVTTVPAQILGLSNRLGTIETGKIANLTVTRGELFSDKGKVREVWVDGVRYEAAKDDGGLAGNWLVGYDQHRFPMIVKTDKDTTVRIVVGSDTLKATNVRLDGQRARFSVAQSGGATELFDITAKNDVLSGTISVPPHSHSVVGSRVVELDKDKKSGDATIANKDVIPSPAVMGNSEPWRMPAPDRPGAVLVRNATVWTVGSQGTLQESDVLVRDGKIAAVGKSLKAPANAVVIDGTGKHVAPGIIDCHNHWAILGNVNECTNSVTAEVRIQDVINSESINIYRELAGGTTMIHLLHGSCNAIGGQCAVIKNRWGAPPDQLLYTAAPPTIKFALGENPKQSNFDNRPSGPPRYPQSRAGVEETIRTAFAAARDYGLAMEEYKKGKRPYPPQRDLQKETVLEILQSKRFIHSHSYRQDEILMLMRVAEEFGIRVQTFQHILEGYKVADEMATHGASASSFSDWWGYKYEVIDAIPYNGYLMWDRGVIVSYNSDDADLARRLNTEAAKAIKYGGVPPDEAIKFVTINPAKQLKVDDKVGSLEAGKDADFTIWNGSPLSPYSLCEQTWIDGRKYFDRAADLAGRQALAQERNALIAKAKAAKKRGDDKGERPLALRYLDDTDMSGNDCGGEHVMPFVSEAERRARQNSEVQK